MIRLLFLLLIALATFVSSTVSGSRWSCARQWHWVPGFISSFQKLRRKMNLGVQVAKTLLGILPLFLEAAQT